MKKISKILGVALTVTVVASLLLMSVPASALGAPGVSFKKDHDVISKADPEQTVTFTLGKELGGAESSTLSVPDPADAITITDATGGDSGTITVTAGSVAVTVTGTGTIASTPIIPATGAVA